MSRVKLYLCPRPRCKCRATAPIPCPEHGVAMVSLQKIRERAFLGAKGR